MYAWKFTVLVFMGLPAGQALAQDPHEILSQADHFADLGNGNKARDLYARAERDFHARGDTRNELDAKFGRLHRDVESGSYAVVLSQIETDLKRTVVENDPALKIRALALKGLIDLNIDTIGAEGDFTQMLSLAKSLGDQKWQNRAAGELGIVAGVNGDLGTASVAIRNAIRQAVVLHDLSAEVYFSIWLANGMTVNGMADRALPVLDHALDAVKQNPDAGVPAQLYIARIRALIYLPDRAAALAGRAEAMQLIDQTLSTARQGKILGAQTELLNQAGVLAREDHRLADAEKYFNETARVAQQADLPRMQAEAMLNLSEIYSDQGRNAMALRAVDSAIVEVRAVQEAFGLPLYLARKAEVEVSLQRPRAADAIYEQATELAEGLLVDAPNSRIKASMIATMGDIYVDRFRLAVTHFHDPAKAFIVLETARGRALADSLRYSRDAQNGGHPVMAAAADAEIARIQRVMRETPTSPAQMDRLLQKLDDAYNQLVPTEYAENREEMKTLFRPVSAARVQKSLRPGETLVEYILDSHKNSYALELTAHNVRVHTLPPRDEVDKLVQSYLAAVKQKGNPDPLAKKLFEEILAPALNDHPRFVTVIPDGSLHMVPFASLLDANAHYAMQSMAIASAPSATVFQILRTRDQTSTATRPFLGVAYSPVPAPSDSPGIEGKKGLLFNGRPLKLPPLPYAVEEVTAAAQTLGERSVLLTGDRASEAAVKAEPLQDFKIIHIAAHGIGAVTEPDRAAFVLALGNEREDGYWQAREIRRSRLSADLVTLSACESGVGRLQGEEGVMNMARTFLVAGAKSVVASLWETDDRFTATVMTHFYKHIAEGESAAEALRAAQSEMLAEFGKDAQPYYWAGFMVIGDGTRKVFSQADRTHALAAR
jgi:CHAT domain-containing protein